MSHNLDGIEEVHISGKPCRTCTDFQSWAKQTRKSMSKDKEISMAPKNPDCPLDKDSLGNNTWSFLHTMAAYFPEKPTPQEKHDMKIFFNILSEFYPCETCAKDLRKELKSKPPVVENQQKLSQWLCELHNTVNVKLGKPVFDCSRVNERWKDGWLDGSCD